MPTPPAPTHPFQADRSTLIANLERFVDITIADLTSEFLILPKGSGFIEFEDFRDAYEVLKASTHAFHRFSLAEVLEALRANSRAFVVIRAMLGLTAPEWSDVVRTELDVNIDQGAARLLDRECRNDTAFFATEESRYREWERAGRRGRQPVWYARLTALVEVAVTVLTQGAPPEQPGVVHRMAKFDTQHGLDSIQYAAAENVPYAMMLYERYLGRPFATHRDAVSELVGEVMENAIEDRLRAAGVSYRKTKKAERIPGFGQAPDFCIPDEIAPVLIIEAKITSDDGTARDKVTRIRNLVTQRDRHVAAGEKKFYEVVACIDGRGFRERREDMRQLLTELDGKVFTTATLDQLFECTALKTLRTLP